MSRLSIVPRGIPRAPATHTAWVSLQKCGSRVPPTSLRSDRSALQATARSRWSRMVTITLMLCFATSQVSRNAVDGDELGRGRRWPSTKHWCIADRQLDQRQDASQFACLARVVEALAKVIALAAGLGPGRVGREQWQCMSSDHYSLSKRTVAPLHAGNLDVISIWAGRETGYRTGNHCLGPSRRFH